MIRNTGKKFRIQEKWHQKIFNKIFQRDIKNSLKINKQNIILRVTITKGSLLLIFQFCMHLMNLYISWLFNLLSMQIRIREAFFNADPCKSGSETLLQTIINNRIHFM